MGEKKEFVFNFDTQIVEEMSFLKSISKKYEVSEEDREDLVSDAILKAYKYKKQANFENREKFQGWLCCIMDSIFINKVKRNQRYPIINYDNEQFINFFEYKVFTNECADSELLIKEEKIIIDNFLLDDLDKKIILGYAQGYSYNHLQEILDIPMGTIKSKIFHIRKRIKENKKIKRYGNKKSN